MPLHVGTALAGATHGVHEAPQVVTSALLTHWAPHAWKPLLHSNLHALCIHLTWPFATAGHTVLQLPQCVGLEDKSTH